MFDKPNFPEKGLDLSVKRKNKVLFCIIIVQLSENNEKKTHIDLNSGP